MYVSKQLTRFPLTVVLAVGYSCFSGVACGCAGCDQLRAKSPEAKTYFEGIKDDFGDDYIELTDPVSLSQVCTRYA